MRVEQYQRELIGGCIEVLGNKRSTANLVKEWSEDTYINDIDFMGCFIHENYEYASNDAIEMSSGYRRLYDDSPYHKSLDEIFQYAHSDMIWDPESPDCPEGFRDFYPNMQAILRGEYPGWKLIGFRVSVGEIALIYANEAFGEQHEGYYIYIKNAPHVHLTFRLKPTVLGFTPLYHVHITRHTSSIHIGPDIHTLIREDLGYMHRDMELYEKDGKTYADTVEFAGL